LLVSQAISYVYKMYLKGIPYSTPGCAPVFDTIRLANRSEIRKKISETHFRPA